jgi:hypothetical protein
VFEELRDALAEKYVYWEQDIEDGDVLDFAEYDLADFIRNSGEFRLFRYMPATYFNIRNIETQTIHLSANGVMNDIYEGLPILDDEASYFKIQKLKDLALMSCLTEDKDNILMWSHYADNHTGICVEYDIKRLQDDPFTLCKHLFPIVYGKKRLIKRDIDSLIRNHQDLKKAIAEDYCYDGDEELNDILPLFLTKGEVWKYEREWRIIFTKKQMYNINSDELYEGNLKFPCVSAVYLGYRIHPEIRKNIMEICGRISTEGNPVSVYQAKLDNEGYGIGFVQLEIDN